MNVLPVSIPDVAASLLFVGVAIVVSRVERAGETRQLIIASLRAMAQLAAVGFIIRAVFGFESLIPTALFVATMMLFATRIASSRGANVPGATRVSFIAIGSGSGSVLLCMLAFGILPAQAQYIIPIAGMLTGNAMSSAGIALREIGRDRIRSRAEIESALALGATTTDAMASCRSRTFRAALGPLIDATKAVGVVSLPGAMTGMILAGASPLRAVQLQAIVMFMLLGATAISIWITVRLGTASLCDGEGRLLESAAEFPTSAGLP